MGAEQSKVSAKARAAIDEHRSNIYEQQLSSQKSIETLKIQARQQLELGNKQGALQLARQIKLMQNHSAQLGSIISNLDAHRVQLETKELTNKSHAVLKMCVNTLGSNMISANELDRTLDQHDSVSAELKEVAEMLSLPVDTDGFEDEDTLLSMLSEGARELQGTNTSTATPASTVALDPDTAFLDYVQSLVTETELPSVPEHEPLPSAPSHDIRRNPPSHPGNSMVM